MQLNLDASAMGSSVTPWQNMPCVHIVSVRPAFNQIYAQAIDLADRHARAQEISRSFYQASQRGESPDQTSHPSEFDFAILHNTAQTQKDETDYVAALFKLTERYRLLLSRLGGADTDRQMTPYKDFIVLMVAEAKVVLENACKVIPNIPSFQMRNKFDPEDERNDPLCLSLAWAFQDAMAGKVELVSAFLNCLTYRAAQAEFMCRTPRDEINDAQGFARNIGDAINWVATDIEQTEKLHDSFVEFIKSRPVLGKALDMQRH